MSNRKNNNSRSSTPAGSAKQSGVVSPLPSSGSSQKNRSHRKRAGSENDHENLDSVTAQAYSDALEDVHTRFILNLPRGELETSDRIFFQLEQAWWFYDDFLCDDYEEQEKISLPRFSNLYPFCKKMFAISPLLNHMVSQFDSMWEEFSKYKRKISTYGTILLNQECTKVVLCQVWQGKSWTFPAGKVNQGEHGIDAGARETYEETGFDPNCNLGRTREMAATLQSHDGAASLPWKPLAKGNALTYVEEGTGKRRTCYVCRNVPEDFPFAPVARKEVSRIEWHELNKLPKKSYAVLPFLNQLKRWIRKSNKQQRQANKNNKSRSNSNRRNPDSRSNSNKRNSGSRSNSNKRSENRNSNGRSSRGKIRNENDKLVQSGLANIGDEKGWTEDEMFRRNEEMIGRKVEYDGNPHIFALKGFDGGIDPHAFHVVGGSFMNDATGSGVIAKAPDVSRLQPLFRNENNEDKNEGSNSDRSEVGGLMPFFSDQGATPWGEVVDEAKAEEGSNEYYSEATTMYKSKKKQQRKQRSRASSDESDFSLSQNQTPTFMGGSNASGLAILNMLNGKGKNSNEISQSQDSLNENNTDDVFLTDREITKRSQDIKLGSINNKEITTTENERKKKTKDEIPSTKEKSIPSEREDENLKYLRQWVKQLPEVPPTEYFGDFRFDTDAILKAMTIKGH